MTHGAAPQDDAHASNTGRTQISVPDDEAVHGRCSVCGGEGRFPRNHRSIREGFRCPDCAASLRYRHQACVLISLYGRKEISSIAELVAEPELGSLAIYEPGMIGPFRRYLRSLPDYTASYYWPGVERGEVHKGVRCEDLQSLTFSDERFDLIITSDIFEHIRHPYTAFAEVARTLKPGGRHVFTVPMQWPFSEHSTPRVDTSGPEDDFVLPPIYHGSPTDSRGSLVYTDFGADLVERLTGMGLPTRIVPGLRSNVTFVSERDT